MKSGIRKVFLYGILVAAGIASGSCTREETKKKLVFRAKPEELAGEAGARAQKIAQRDPDNSLLVVVLPGKFYNPPKSVSLVPRNAVNRKRIEGAVAASFSALRERNFEWMEENFVPQIRESKKALFDTIRTNQAVLDAMKSEQSRYTSREIWGILEDGKQAIVLLGNNGERPNGMLEVYERTPEGWFLTERPSDDPTLAIVRAACRNKRVKKIK